jgi:hypothetical protein
MSYAEGDSYVGEWANDKREGHGQCTWADGRVYRGAWRANFRCGLGKMTWPCGALYEGQWDNNKFNGHGVYSWADGRRYVGQLKVPRHTAIFHLYTEIYLLMYGGAGRHAVGQRLHGLR